MVLSKSNGEYNDILKFPPKKFHCKVTTEMLPMTSQLTSTYLFQTIKVDSQGEMVNRQSIFGNSFDMNETIAIILYDKPRRRSKVQCFHIPICCVIDQILIKRNEASLLKVLPLFLWPCATPLPSP